MTRQLHRLRIAGRTIVASEVLGSYWTLAAERQRVYHARLAGNSPPWTTDPVVQRYRFTNAYRAADRVSQDLIRVLYAGSQEPRDLILRTLIFRFFNRPETWTALENARGRIDAADFDAASYAEILDELMAQGSRVYSAAYIIPPPVFGHVRKHRNHLALVEHMMNSGLETSLAQATSLQQVYLTLLSFPSLGPFLAYQLTVDLNYTTLIDFDEDEFVVAGPGALSGIRKCFPETGGLPPADVIRWMVDEQEEQIEHWRVNFADLFGRRLKLIDCQNLFCETDKYARVAHPESLGKGNRSRIKQQYSWGGRLDQPFFPPKWGLMPAPRTAGSPLAVEGPGDAPPQQFSHHEVVSV